VRKPLIRVALAAGALLTAGLIASTAGSANAAPAATHQGRHAVRVCPATGKPTIASCLSKVMVNRKGVVPDSSTPPSSAMSPTDLKAAYNLSGLSSGGRTVAVVDAYGYPNLESDLATYRSYYKLPACTTANGCLKVVDQNGGTSLPRFDSGWAGEQALDVDAVSAICPDCHILVVQAKTSSIANLGTAVNTAAKAGAVAISNSYGGGDLSDNNYGSYYNHKGIAVTASTGDNGYQGGSFPASSDYVTAVGGTSLYRSGSSYSESAWSGAGSGCSTVNAALPEAATFGTGCSMRAIADVSAAADPNNGGMAVYYPTSKVNSTWAQVGGTSESSPIIASVFALAGSTYSGYSNAVPYQHATSLNDVTGGSNGTCPTTQWCNARSGWDGPTGLGTPNGTGAF
jgi:subtilase family serine protease